MWFRSRRSAETRQRALALLARLVRVTSGNFLLGRALAGILVVVTVASRGIWSRNDFEVGAALALVGWIASSTAAAALARRLGSRGRIVLGGILYGDCIAAALAVRAAGGLEGPAVLLFALPVLGGVLVLKRPWSLWQGVFTAVLYALLGLETLAGEPVGSLWSSILFHTLLLSAFGVAAALVGLRVTKILREAASSRSELEAFRLSTDVILESLTCGLFAIDPGGRIRVCNPEAARLAAGSPDSCATRSDAPDEPADIWTLLEGGNDRLLAMIEEQLRDGDQEGCERELALRRVNGETFPALVKIASVHGRYGEYNGLVVLIWDLTERKRIEEVGRRQERLAAVGELAAGLAHEIRNSLKPITGSIELLTHKGRLAAEAAPIAALIAREADSLEAFLSQFLTLTRHKALKFEEINLEKLIRDEIGALRLGPLGADHRVHITGAGAQIQADREWLRQALRNLILNAMEATAHGSVALEIAEFVKGSQPWVRVAVSDDGPGLQAIGPGEAFEPFRTTKPTGTGLGLSIVQRAVHEHGGNVAFDTTREHGARVVIELPCRPASATVRALALV